MNQDPVSVQKVHWLRVLPLLQLFQAVPAGCQVSALTLSLLLLGISWWGSAAIHNACVNIQTPEFHHTDLLGAFPWNRWEMPGQHELAHDGDSMNLPEDVVPGPLSVLGKSASRLFVPAADFGSRTAPSGPTPSQWMLLSGLLIWNSLVIGLLGTAIARTTATQFCRQSRTGFFAALKRGLRSFPSVAVSIGITLLLLILLRAVLGVASLVSSTGSAGAMLVSIVWPVVFLASACLILSLGVLGFAWLLSLAAIATDGCSGADALSRSISYVLSHRLFTLVCAAMTAVLSLVAHYTASVMLSIASSALPIGLVNQEPDRMRRTWDSAISLIPSAVHLSVMFAGISMTYLLLRQREDGTRLETIHESNV